MKASVVILVTAFAALPLASLAAPYSPPVRYEPGQHHSTISDQPKGPIREGAEGTCSVKYEEASSCTGDKQSKIKVVTVDNCPSEEKCDLEEHTGSGGTLSIPSGSCRITGSKYTAKCIKK